VKRDTIFIYRVCLAIGDIVAIIVAFLLGYWARITLDPRPIFFTASPLGVVLSVISLIPLWLIILSVAGLYSQRIIARRSREYGRLFIASVIGLMAFITYAYFIKVDIFPVRWIALYTLAFSFLLLVLTRETIKAGRGYFLKRGVGTQKVLITGNSANTPVILNDFLYDKGLGYQVVAVVANKQYVPPELAALHFSSLKLAVEAAKPDVIIQTDELDTSKVYSQAINVHADYMFVPNQAMLASKNGELFIIGSLPIVKVLTTPLIGAAKFIKRACDLILGGLTLVITSPVMLVVALIIKLGEPKGHVFYKEKRFTRFGRKRYIYKFRSHKLTYNGLTPEKAFTKMGRPELIAEYRANGDYLSNDPRITKIGHFLRKTSLDELPQLLNVVKGDISLVGPRALQPGELDQYPNKNLILSVKSGLTGLAQVSGRRSISFEERRLLDIYYIQNWSLLLDIQILVRTVIVVLAGRGAK